MQKIIRGITYTYDQKLAKMYKKIEDSAFMLDLEESWDGFGADVIKPITWYRAILFLQEYANLIITSGSSVCDSLEINPSRNGDIHISWDSD